MRAEKFQQYKDAPFVTLAAPTRDYSDNDEFIYPISTQIVRLTGATASWNGQSWDSYEFVADVPVIASYTGINVMETAMYQLFEFLAEDEPCLDDGVGIYAWDNKGQAKEFSISCSDDLTELIVSAKIINRTYFRDWGDPDPDIPIKIYRGETSN